MGKFFELRRSKSQKYPIPFLIIISLLAIIPASAKADSAQYFYDPGSRASGVLDSVNGTAQYSFDKAGNITAISKAALTALTVLQASPSAAAIGTAITVYGTGFGTVSNTSVKFNGTSATPSAVTSTSITVAVPTGATTGTLSVTAPAGTVNMAAPFTVLPSAAPTITSFTTGTGTPTIASVGATVTITGTNFDNAYSKVLVDNQYAQVTSATATTLVITVPPSSSGKIIVQTPTGTVTSTSDLIIAPSGFATTAVNSVRTTVGASPVTATNGGTGTVSLVLADVTAGQRITTGVNLSGVAGCPTISTIMPNGSAAAPATETCSGYYFSGPTMANTGAGTYSLEFVPSSTSGTYQAQIFNVPPDVFQAATITGTTFNATLTGPGQQANFTFSGTSGQNVSLLLGLASTLTCSNYTLTNPDGSLLFVTTETCSEGSYLNTPFTLPQTGTYTFNINPLLTEAGLGVGTASITLFSVPTTPTATVTVGGAEVKLSITVPGEQAAFTFSGTSGNSYTSNLDFSAMTPCNYYSVLNPDGTTLYAQTESCSGSASTGSLAVSQTGTFKILVVPYLGGGTTTSGTGMVGATVTHP